MINRIVIELFTLLTSAAYNRHRITNLSYIYFRGKKVN